jgi:hypothetical protein
MQEFPVKIDALLEPRLTATSDAQANELLSQLITVHEEPVIKGVIRFKLRFNANQEMQRAEARDIQQDVVLQLVSQLQRVPPSYQELVKRALTSQRIERSSQLQGLTRPPSSLMGGNDQARKFSVSNRRELYC